MSEKVQLKGNKIKVLDRFWQNDKIGIIMILFILHYSISGKTKSLELNKIAFIIDAVRKSLELSKLSTLLSAPWEISAGLRKRIILANNKGLLTINDKNGKVSFELTVAGRELVSSIENQSILTDLTDDLKLWSKSVSVSQLKSQQLVW